MLEDLGAMKLLTGLFIRTKFVEVLIMIDVLNGFRVSFGSPAYLNSVIQSRIVLSRICIIFDLLLNTASVFGHYCRLCRKP